MPDRSKYPDWFCPHMKPSKPYLPREFINVDIKSEKIPICEYISIEKFLEIGSETLLFEIDCDNGYDKGYRHELNVTWFKTVKNLSYEHELVKYNIENEKYEKQLAEWKFFKAQWDAQVLAENEEEELKVYERLKAKFEK